MAAEKTTSTTTATPAPANETRRAPSNAGQFVRSQAPINTGNLSSLKLDPTYAKALSDGEKYIKMTGHSANVEAAGADQTAEAKTAVPEGKKAATNVHDRLLELNELDMRGLLTLDQKAEREALKKMEDAEGKTDQKKDDDIRGDDPDKDKFAEEDVIKYMYDKWLIALVEWCSQKIEKGLDCAWEKGRRRMLRKRAERDAETKAYHKTPTYKAKETIADTVFKRKEKLKDAKKKEIKFLPKISSKIADGTLFDKDGNGNYSLEAIQFAKYVGLLTPDGKVDEANIENNKAWLNLQKAMQAKKQAKEAGDEEAFAKTSADLRKTGSKFVMALTRRISYDCERDQVALMTAGARMMDEISANPKAFDGKDLTAVFDENVDTADKQLRAATDKERQSHAMQPILGLSIFNEAGLDAVSRKATEMNLPYMTLGDAMSGAVLSTQTEKGTLNSLWHNADRALNRAEHGIEKRYVKELGYKPLKNKGLDFLNEDLGVGKVENKGNDSSAKTVEKGSDVSAQPKGLQESTAEFNQATAGLNSKLNAVEEAQQENAQRSADHFNNPLAERIQKIKQGIPAYLMANKILKEQAHEGLTFDFKRLAEMKQQQSIGTK